MYPIHIISSGGKGGVGQTFVTQTLCQHLSSKGEKFNLIEVGTNDRTDSIGQMYREQATSTHTLTLDPDPLRSPNPDIICDIASQAPTVISLPSNASTTFERWASKRSLLKLMRERYGGKRIAKWFISDGSYASLSQLEASLDANRQSIPHIFIFNQERCNTWQGFRFIKQELIYKTVRKHPSFVTGIEFPRLTSYELPFFIDRTGLTLEAARDSIAEKIDTRVKAKQETKELSRYIDECAGFWTEAMETLKQCWEQSGEKPEADADTSEPDEGKVSQAKTQTPQATPRRKINPHV
jgi:hypothetical protein